MYHVTPFNSLCSGYTPYQYAASAETLTPVQLTQVLAVHIVGHLNQGGGIHGGALRADHGTI
jgi:hypothetical protein